MSYTPTTWTTGDTITASAMNKIENGIANAGGGGTEVVIIYMPNSTIGYQAEGDFASCLAKVQNGEPIFAFIGDYSSYSGGFVCYMGQTLACSYDSNYPNRIDLQITGGVGYFWTENGVEYYD